MLLFASSGAYAQEEGEPVILAMDTTIAGAAAFDNALLRVVGDYKPAFTDKNGTTIVAVYKNEDNQTLRTEYKYVLDDESKQQQIIYQKVTADVVQMLKIYNFLFRTTLTEAQMLYAISTGTPFTYKGRNYQYTLGTDEYRPGYWTLVFLRG